MNVSRKSFAVAIVAVALTVAGVAASPDALARGAHGGHGGHGGHRGSASHSHGHQPHLREHRHQQHRHFFKRFTPCTVWTRQGWTRVCPPPR